MGFPKSTTLRTLVKRQISKLRSVDVSKVMKTYYPSLPSYLPALRVGLDTAIVSPFIKGCAHHAHQAGTLTSRLQMFASSARRVGTALQMVPLLRHHARCANQGLTHLRRDPASACHAPLAVLVLTTELRSTHCVPLAGTTALWAKPSVSRALVGSMDHMREQRYVWTVHWVPSRIAQVL